MWPIEVSTLGGVALNAETEVARRPQGLASLRRVVSTATPEHSPAMVSRKSSETVAGLLMRASA